MLTLIASLFIALSVQDGPAPTIATPQDREVEVEEVVVEGRRLRDAANDYVKTVGRAPRGAELGHWGDPVCVSVAGLARPHGQVMVDRIAQVALAAGIEVGRPGCDTNVMIVATDDGQGAAEALIDGYRWWFRPPVDRSDLGRSALHAFRTSDAPVRWWHVAWPVSVHTGEMVGRVAGGAAPGLVEATKSLGLSSSATSGIASRLSTNTTHRISTAVVVIDLGQLNGVDLGTVMDYTAMVALAQVDATADFSGQPTVLNLFDRQGEVRESGRLTDWDLDYLKALQTARRDHPNHRASVSTELIALREARRTVVEQD